jgi:hypothetical protein
MEDESAPERLSKGVSTISLGDDKKKVSYKGFCPNKHLLRLQSVGVLLLVFGHMISLCWSLMLWSAILLFCTSHMSPLMIRG